MSKQLRYMKRLGIVESERQAQWMVYRLADPDHPLLAENLKCLQDCAAEELQFRLDSKKRHDLLQHLKENPSSCAESLLAGKSHCST